MWNAVSTQARMIEVISPAGFENFFRELAAVTAAGPVDFEVVGKQPDWLGDVIARYNLTPLPH
jgi:hypothetical protein